MSAISTVIYEEILPDYEFIGNAMDGIVSFQINWYLTVQRKLQKQPALLNMWIYKIYKR